MRKNKTLENFDTHSNINIQCICPKCGHEVSKRENKSCVNMDCPVCKTKLIIK